MKTLEPKSLLEVREWKEKVSAEMNRLGIKKYHEKSRHRTDSIIKAMCAKRLTAPITPKERRLSKV